jgi:hypothetical protein
LGAHSFEISQVILKSSDVWEPLARTKEISYTCVAANNYKKHNRNTSHDSKVVKTISTHIYLEWINNCIILNKQKRQ